MARLQDGNKPIRLGGLAIPVDNDDASPKRYTDARAPEEARYQTVRNSTTGDTVVKADEPLVNNFYLGKVRTDLNDKVFMIRKRHVATDGTITTTWSQWDGQTPGETFPGNVVGYFYTANAATAQFSTDTQITFDPYGHYNIDIVPVPGFGTPRQTFSFFGGQATVDSTGFTWTVPVPAAAQINVSRNLTSNFYQDGETLPASGPYQVFTATYSAAAQETWLATLTYTTNMPTS